MKKVVNKVDAAGVASKKEQASPDTSKTPQSLLVEWANQQDNWVRALVSEVITTRQDIPDARVQHYYELLLREKELSPGGTVNVPPLSGRLDTAAAGNGFALTVLQGTQNINALTPAQRVEFNPRLTILFGENASGKTGYVRILKRAAAVRTAETVLPNVMSAPASSNTPAAQLGYQLGTQTSSVDWANEAGVHSFTRMDVFDSRCTQLHLDEDLTYIYTPGELSLFPLVQQGVEKVKAKLEADTKRRSTVSNPFLREFDRGSRVYTKIESLSAATTIQELRELANVPEEERTQVGALKVEIEALRSQSPEAQSKVAQAEQQFLESMQRALKIIAEFDLGRYESARIELARAREGYDRATRSAFAGLEIPGILQPEWRAFVQAGEALIASTGQAGYPSDSDRCVYCQQRLDGAAIELIRKYRDYCNNQLEASVVAAERTLAGITASLVGLDTSSLLEAVSRRRAETAERSALSFLEGASRAFAAAAELKGRIASNEAYNRPTLSAEATQTEKNVDAQRRELVKVGADLNRRSEERQSALKEREVRFLDVSSRLRLSERLPDVELYVEEAQWVTKAVTCGRRFQAVFKSLTDASKSASEKLLNHDFEKHFRKECEKLRAPEVKLFFPGRHGQVTRHKSVVADHRLSEILSEGEQKVIALADFLAEVGLKPKAPVIFDDPVNSLDYRRMAELVDRLVELSRERQVVIFTHNIWFTMEMLSRFEKNTADCSYYDVQGDGVRLGIISKGAHPRADNFKTLSGKLNSLIQSAGKETGEAQLALIEKGYEYLRSICEVVVETELLQGVTQRYQPNVRMNSLPNIKFDRLRDAAEAIFAVFEKCCRCITSHSQPLETLNVRPNLSDLKADWKSIEDARTKHQASNQTTLL